MLETWLETRISVDFSDTWLREQYSMLVKLLTMWSYEFLALKSKGNISRNGFSLFMHKGPDRMS